MVALDGDRPRRLREAITLALAEEIPIVVAVRGDAVAPELSREQLPFAFLSFVPDPSTTRGEARGVAHLAGTNGWKRIIVVTSTYHVPRTKLIFRRAIPQGVEVRAAGCDRRGLPRNLLLECAKLVLALTVRRRP